MRPGLALGLVLAVAAAAAVAPDSAKYSKVDGQVAQKAFIPLKSKNSLSLMACGGSCNREKWCATCS